MVNSVCVKLHSTNVPMIQTCRAIYRQEHPELDNIVLPNNKVLYEVMRYYIESYGKEIQLEKGVR